MSDTATRREVLERLGVGAAGLAALGLGRTAYAANDTIQIGIIGCGGRARHLMGALPSLPGVKVVAVCDVYTPNREGGRKAFGGDAVKGFVDHRELLAQKDVDGVLVATPDHWHVPVTIDAVKAGKDVYVEKPLLHKLEEGPAILAAMAGSDRIVQVGTQQRSMPQFHKAKEMIRAGRLGPVRKVHMSWNRNGPPSKNRRSGVKAEDVDWKRFLGNAPDQPFDGYRMQNWRWMWDFGNGILTDLMVHWLDAVIWLLELDRPAEALTIGNHFAAEGVWETPDTIQTFLHYDQPALQCYFEGTFVNCHNRAMCTLMGEHATLYLDRGRYELHPERPQAGAYEEEILGKGVRGADFYDNPPGELLHLSNWLECMRTRKQPNAPVADGVKAAAAALMGNLAYRERRVVTRD